MKLIPWQHFLNYQEMKLTKIKLNMSKIFIMTSIVINRNLIMI